MIIECPICPRHCRLDGGQTGFCGARENVNNKIISVNYGKITSMALDPIEKKPLRCFYPGSFILSIGGFGCNLRCPYCQNHRISMPSENPPFEYLPPGSLIDKAISLKPRGNIGIAYTYNEPIIGYEYIMDCAKLARANGLKNVIVTNGYVSKSPFLELLPLIDALNIDLKSFSNDYYKKLGGELNTVKNTISLAAEKAHIEVTTLIIPNENDSPSEIESLSQWLSGVKNTIPLHISRFFPNYKYHMKDPTPVDTVYALADIARKYLTRVYTGNC